MVRNDVLVDSIILSIYEIKVGLLERPKLKRSGNIKVNMVLAAYCRPKVLVHSGVSGLEQFLLMVVVFAKKMLFISNLMVDVCLAEGFFPPESNCGTYLIFIIFLKCLQLLSSYNADQICSTFSPQNGFYRPYLLLVSIVS